MVQMIAGTDYSVIESVLERFVERVFEVIFKGIFKGSVFNESVVANTNIFDSDLEPTGSYSTFRIYAAFNAAGILIVRRTRAGVTVSEELNSGAALVADAAYMFDILVETGDSINIRYGAAATCLSLKILEILGVIS